MRGARTVFVLGVGNNENAPFIYFKIYKMKYIPYEYDLKSEYFEKLKDQRKAKKANKLRAFGTPKKK